MTNENKGAKVVDSTVEKMLRGQKGREGIVGLRIQMAEADPPRWEPAKLDEMAHGLAYTFACSLIESNTLSEETPKGNFYDIRQKNVTNAAMEDLRDGVSYLEQRGLLYRHPKQPHLVSLRDESEAIR